MTPTNGQTGQAKWETIEMLGGEAPSAMQYAYGDEGPSPQLSAACLAEIQPVYRSASSLIPSRVAGVSIRDGLSRSDYDYYRPAEAIPRKHREVIVACDEAYQRIGLLRNIIDLMSDFASQGIEIFHPNPSKQLIYRAWFKKVGGRERSERFLNLLYRHGNVIIKRAYTDLNVGDRDDLERGVAGRPPAEPEDLAYQRGPKVYKNRVPIQYQFLNPTAIEVIGGDLALFAGDPRYAIRLPEPLIRLIKNPKTADDVRLVGQLPAYITEPVRAGKKSIPLDPSRVDVFTYKKDDWQQWAFPMTYSILADLKLYEKNKLADMAALDGAVSHIRLWKLGLPEYKIQPGPAAFARLREQLAAAATSGGVLDLIWDASLDLKETSSDVYNFLGMKKYEPVLQAIYAGLGIPQSLTGSSNSAAGGMTNNAMSLKTLIERLQYGRDLLRKMWENELNILQEAWGHKQPAQMHFENMSISDEANEKMLWVHLVDRDIISVETLREKFGTIPEVEKGRVRREYQARKDDTVPEKVGPFNEPAPNPEAAAQKAMQTGLLAPSETKMKTQPKKAGDKTLLDRQQETEQQKINLEKDRMEHDKKMKEKELKMQEKQGEDLHQQQLQHKDEEHKVKLQMKQEEHKVMLPVKKQSLKQQIKKKGQPGAGRPPGSRDQQKRKRKVVSPRTAASVMAFTEMQAWARKAQRAIADAITPLYLDRCNKRNMRGLTTAQADEFESVKFQILCSLEPGSDLSQEHLSASFHTLPAPEREVEDLLRSLGEAPVSVDELRERHITAYALANMIDSDED